MKYLFISLIIAGTLWAIIFSALTADIINFWFALSFSSIVLALLGIVADKENKSHKFRWKNSYILIGIASAAMLYGIFALGHFLISLIIPQASKLVQNVYFSRSLLPLPAISVMLILIAPAEEIYWRGFLQKRLSNNFGKTGGLLIGAFAYSIVHIWSFNPVLLLAALICGLFWGCLFMHFDSIWPGIISHTFWDLTIFVILPLK